MALSLAKCLSFCFCYFEIKCYFICFTMTNRSTSTQSNQPTLILFSNVSFVCNYRNFDPETLTLLNIMLIIINRITSNFGRFIISAPALSRHVSVLSSFLFGTSYFKAFLHMTIF